MDAWTLTMAIPPEQKPKGTGKRYPLFRTEGNVFEKKKKKHFSKVSKKKLPTRNTLPNTNTVDL